MNIASFFRKLIIKTNARFSNNLGSKSIFYHDFHSNKRYTDMSTNISLFMSHIDSIKKIGFDIVSEIDCPLNQIEISLDDGFLGIFDNIDFLDKINIPIQLFVVTSFIGKKNYLNRDQILELNSLSNIRFSSHTHTHKELTSLNKKDVNLELNMSKSILEDLLNESIETLSFPKGLFSNDIIEMSLNSGYKKLYTSIPGCYSKEFNKNLRFRSLVQFADKVEFESILKGGDNILTYWYKKKHYKL